MTTRSSGAAGATAGAAAPAGAPPEGRGLKGASLFSGCGGLDLGLVQAGHEARALRGGRPHASDRTAKLRVFCCADAPAAAWAGTQIILQCEIDPCAQAVLRVRFPGVRLTKDGARPLAAPPLSHLAALPRVPPQLGVRCRAEACARGRVALAGAHSPHVAVTQPPRGPSTRTRYPNRL
jgi:hypothetical protein